jgi:hypothetical protein
MKVFAIGFDINVRVGLDFTVIVSVGNLEGPYTFSGPVNVRASLRLSYNYGVTGADGTATSWLGCGKGREFPLGTRQKWKGL